jgi:hypothetical protein
MKIEKRADATFVISMTLLEKNVISNCMNYMCRARVPRDFHALVGVEVSEAIELLNSLLSVD